MKTRKDEEFLEWKRSVLPSNAAMFGRLGEARWKEKAFRKSTGEFGDDSFRRYAYGMADDEKTYLGAIETVRKIRDEFVRRGEMLPDWTEPPDPKDRMTELRIPPEVVRLGEDAMGAVVKAGLLHGRERRQPRYRVEGFQKWMFSMLPPPEARKAVEPDDYVRAMAAAVPGVPGWEKEGEQAVDRADGGDPSRYGEAVRYVRGMRLALARLGVECPPWSSPPAVFPVEEDEYRRWKTSVLPDARKTMGTLVAMEEGDPRLFKRMTEGLWKDGTLLGYDPRDPELVRRLREYLTELGIEVPPWTEPPPERRVRSWLKEEE